ncbi:MAG: hypothetical protein ACO39C_09365 [Chthoniobacterales bacterium]
MRKTPVAPPEKVQALARELDEYHDCRDFAGTETMADLLVRHLERLLTDQIHR